MTASWFHARAPTHVRNLLRSTTIPSWHPRPYQGDSLEFNKYLLLIVTIVSSSLSSQSSSLRASARIYMVPRIAHLSSQTTKWSSREREKNKKKETLFNRSHFTILALFGIYPMSNFFPSWRSQTKFLIVMRTVHPFVASYSAIILRSNWNIVSIYIYKMRE